MTVVQRGFICRRQTGEVVNVNVSTWDAPCGGGWVEVSALPDTQHNIHLKRVEEILHTQRSNASLSLKHHLCIEYLIEYGCVHVHNPQSA